MTRRAPRYPLRKVYGRAHVKRAAHRIALAVHQGDMNEVAVPLVLRATIRTESGHVCYDWLHTPGMRYFKKELARLRAQQENAHG